MKTKIFNSRQIKEAAELIKKGELVAFPTETVYGLGANALDSKSVKKIFTVKGRPSDNPLIVHITRKEELKKIAKIHPSKKVLVEKVISKYWPGPLTIILHKTERVPLGVTGGLNTVAIRMPKNKIARRLIDYSKSPIAAPSANLSGKPSGTCSEHVFEDFDGKIAGIIKSNGCKIGLESTVIDLTTKNPVLLRPGAISFENLKKVLPDLEISDHSKEAKVKSPGMKYKHYSPDAEIILFERSARNKIPNYEESYKIQGKKVKVILPEKINNLPRNLFKILRRCDKDQVEYILIASVNEKEIGLAVMDRIRKAASRTIK